MTKNQTTPQPSAAPTSLKLAVSPVAQAQKTKAVIALWLGVASVVCFIVPVLGLLLGIASTILAVICLKRDLTSATVFAAAILGFFGTTVGILLLVAFAKLFFGTTS